MKKNKKHTILFFLFCIGFASIPTKAQEFNFHPGYVIIGGDTIKGYIKTSDHLSNTRQCIFKETPTSPERIYLPDDVVEYGTADKNFYSAEIQLGDRKVFLACLVKSHVSLFFYHDRFFIKGEAGMEELEEVNDQIQRNGKVYTVKRPFYKSTLQKQMEGCPTIHEKLLNTQLTEKSLVALFNEYASCTGHDATQYKLMDPRRRIRYGLTLGLLSAGLKLHSSTNFRYTFGEEASGGQSITFTPGLFIELGLSKRFDLCTGITWYTTKNELESKNQSTNLTHNFLLQASRIEVPFLLKYSISKGNVKWSLKAGCGLNGLIQYKDRLIVSTTSSGFVLNEYSNDLDKNSLIVNGMGGLCTEFSIRKRSILLEAFYSRSGSLVKSETHAGIEGFRFGIGTFL